MARRWRGLRPGGLRLGSRILRSAGLLAGGARCAGMVTVSRLNRCDRPLLGGGDRHCRPAQAVRSIRRPKYHQGRRAFARCGHHRLGDRATAVAALCSNFSHGRGLGRHGCRCGQRDHNTLVRAYAPGGACHGLQWRERRWRRVLAAVGSSDRDLGLPHGSRGGRDRHGDHDLGSGRSHALENTAADGLDAGRRCPRCDDCIRDVAFRKAARTAVVARFQVHDVVRRNGARTFRPDRPARAFVFALGARAGRTVGRLCHGRRDGSRYRRPYARRMADAGGCRSAPCGMCQLPHTNRRLNGVLACGRHEHLPVACRRFPVRCRHRQRNLATASHRPGRIRQERCAAGCCPHCCHRPGCLRVCSSGIWVGTGPVAASRP